MACAEALDAVPGVRHAFFTRRGARGADLDARAGTAMATMAAAAGLPSGRLLQLEQVHGTAVVAMDAGSPVGPAPRADAAVASASAAAGGGAALAVRTADCVPLLLAAVDGAVVAAVHAGWRGVVAGVVEQALEALAARGAAPARLTAALGPAIGGCCYEVAPDVLVRIAAAAGTAPAELARGHDGPRPRLDLRRAVHRQLLRAGVSETAIAAAPWCTRCSGSLFFSHRRDGPGCGRQLAWIGWPDAGTPRSPQVMVPSELRWRRV